MQSLLEISRKRNMHFQGSKICIEIKFGVCFWLAFDLNGFCLNLPWPDYATLKQAMAKIQSWPCFILDNIHAPLCEAKNHATLFINKRMKHLEQTVPALWPWEIIWSSHTSWPSADFSAHFEKIFNSWFGIWELPQCMSEGNGKQ